MVAATSKLQVLTLYNNQLTGTIPSTIGNAQHLQNFDITNNAIFGTIPPSLGNITELKYAVLKFNKLTGAPAVPEGLISRTQPSPDAAHTVLAIAKWQSARLGDAEEKSFACS